VQWLVEHGAQVGRKDLDGFTALHRAAAAGHLGVAKWMVGRSVCGREERGWTHRAA